MTRSRDLSASQSNLGGAVPPVAAGKNAVINGGFDIWQRGTSFTANGYTADRWYGLTPTNITISRQLTNDTTNLPNIQYCVRLARSAGSTAAVYPQIANSFETVNTIPFVGKTVTLSFYARAGANFSASGSQISAYIPTGTGTDQPVTAGYTGETNPVGGAVTLTTTWQRFTFTGTIPTTATEMGVKIFALTAGTAGANDYFEVTGIQVEVGSAATPFTRNGATYQGELAACQRYYWRTTGVNALSMLEMRTTTTAGILLPNPIPMRTSPTLDANSGTGYFIAKVANSSLNINGAWTLDISSPNSTELYATTASVAVAGQAGFAYINNASAYFGMSAEL